MHRIIGGVKVQNDLGRRRLVHLVSPVRPVRFDEQFHQELIDPYAGLSIDAVLQAAERRGRSQGTIRIHIAAAAAGSSIGRQLQDQVVAQRGVIIEVFPTAGNRQHALSDEGALIVLDVQGIAWVGDQLIHAVQQVDAAVHFTQQEHSAIGADRSGVKFSQHRSSRQGCKLNDRLVTVCPHGLASLQCSRVW